MQKTLYKPLIKAGRVLVLTAIFSHPMEALFSIMEFLLA
jgi:hypothetical protein